jgi:hypothetical protein
VIDCHFSLSTTLSSKMLAISRSDCLIRGASVNSSKPDGAPA